LKIYNINYIEICSHEKQTIMDLAAIQIQALVKQAQSEYIFAFATKIGRSLIGPTERMETRKSSNANKNISSVII
jgi:hypothetical protein